MTERGLEATPAHPQQAQRDSNVARGAAQGVGIPDSPFLSVAEAARFCRFDDTKHPEHAFRRWAARENLPIRRRGRKLLIERRILLDKLAPA